MKYKELILRFLTYIITLIFCYWVIFLSNMSIDKLKIFSWLMSLILCYISAYQFAKWITNNKEK